MAGQAFRSKLQPHWNLIRDLRRRKKTWAQIAEILTQEHGCTTQTQSVHAFYKRKLKNPAPLGFEEEQPSADPAAEKNPPSAVAEAPAQPDGPSMLEDYLKRSAAVNEELLRPKRIVLKAYEPRTDAAKQTRASEGDLGQPA